MGCCGLFGWGLPYLQGPGPLTLHAKQEAWLLCSQTTYNSVPLGTAHVQDLTEGHPHKASGSRGATMLAVAGTVLTASTFRCPSRLPPLCLRSRSSLPGCGLTSPAARSLETTWHHRSVYQPSRSQSLSPQALDAQPLCLLTASRVFLGACDSEHCVCAWVRACTPVCAGVAASAGVGSHVWGWPSCLPVNKSPHLLLRVHACLGTGPTAEPRWPRAVCCGVPATPAVTAH